MNAPKYCPDPDNCTYSDCPTAFCDRIGSFNQRHEKLLSDLEEALAANARANKLIGEMANELKAERERRLHILLMVGQLEVQIQELRNTRGTEPTSP